MNIQVIGDLHFDDRYPGQLDAQIGSVFNIIEEGISKKKATHVLFLGDIFDKRLPKPSLIRDVRDKFFRVLNKQDFGYIVLRGNHDSENKSDDGSTSLDLCDIPEGCLIRHSKNLDVTSRNLHFIPHYEDEEIIRSYLQTVGKPDILFGHFGYNGCVSPFDDYDFTIHTSELMSRTFLGHIHEYSEKDKIVVVGTPYQVGFNSKPLKYYAVVNCGSKFKYRIYPTKNEVKFVTLKYENLSELEDYTKDGLFTAVRVLIDPTKHNSEFSVVEEIKNKYKVNWVEVRFESQQSKILQESFEADPSKYNVSSIDSNIIDSYIRDTGSYESKEELITFLEKMKNK